MPVSGRGERFARWCAVCAALAVLPVGCGEPMSLEDRACAADGDCVEGFACDVAVPAGRCRASCDGDGGCAEGLGCDRGYCVPGFAPSCADGAACEAAGYECFGGACVPTELPVAVIEPAEATAPGGTRIVLDGAGSHPAAGATYRWRLVAPGELAGVLDDGAAAATIAPLLPVVDAAVDVAIALQVSLPSGLSDEAVATVHVTPGSPVTLELEAVRVEDGTPVDEARPGLPGELIEVRASAESVAGPAWVTKLAPTGPAAGTPDLSDAPELYRFEVPAGCPAPMTFEAQAEDAEGNGAAASLGVPLTGAAGVGFVARSVTVLPSGPGFASVRVEGDVTKDGAVDPSLVAAAVSVAHPAGARDLMPDGAGAFGGEVPLACVGEAGGLSLAVDLAVAIDAGCGGPVTVTVPGAVPVPLGPYVVAAAAPGGNGSPAAPLATLLEAVPVATAAGCPIVALAAGTSAHVLRPGAATLGAAVRVRGGYDPDGGFAPLAAPAGADPSAWGTTVAAEALSLAAPGAALERLVLEGHCEPGGSALLVVGADASLEDAGVHRTGGCAVAQLGVDVRAGTLSASRIVVRVEPGPAPNVPMPAVSGIRVGPGARAQLVDARIDASADGGDAVGLLLPSDAEAVLDGGEVRASAQAPATATGVQVRERSRLGASRARVVAAGGADSVGLDVADAGAVLDRSVAAAGEARRSIGILAREGASVTVYGGLARGGASELLSAGVFVDGGSVVVRDAREAPEPGPAGPLPPELAGTQANLVGGTGAGLCAALADCRALADTCTSAPGSVDVRRAALAGSAFEGAQSWCARSAGLALGGTTAHVEDSLVSAAIGPGTVGLGVGARLSLSAGAGVTILHSVVAGPERAEQLAAGVHLEPTAAPPPVRILGSYLVPGSAPVSASGSPRAAIRIAETAYALGTLEVNDDLFLLSQGAVALFDQRDWSQAATPDELVRWAPAASGNAVGSLSILGSPPELADCSGCLDAGSAEDDGLDFHLRARSGVADVGPFELQGAGSREVCDGVDNDGDGATDEPPDCGGPVVDVAEGPAAAWAFGEAVDDTLTLCNPSSPLGLTTLTSDPTRPQAGADALEVEFGPDAWTSFQVLYPATRAAGWDLSGRAGVSFAVDAELPASYTGWDYPGPVVVLCGPGGTTYLRLDPVTEWLPRTPGTWVPAQAPFAGDAGWTATDDGTGFDLRRVDWIEFHADPWRDAGTGMCRLWLDDVRFY